MQIKMNQKLHWYLDEKANEYFIEFPSGRKISWNNDVYRIMTRWGITGTISHREEWFSFKRKLEDETSDFNNRIRSANAFFYDTRDHYGDFTTTRYFFSLPLRNKNFEQIAAVIVSATLAVQDKDSKAVIIANADATYPGAKCESLACLGRALQLMGTCDAVVMFPGWQQARGCVIEHEAALKYGLKIFDLTDVI